jgi:NAD(P)-dependent dehydrogenase (short-subunit alcohol dehydrogenase family)
MTAPVPAVASAAIPNSLAHVLHPGAVAVVTGAASGIGLAAARRFASFGLRVVLVDLPGDRLTKAAAEVAALAPNGERDVFAQPTDVSRRDEVQTLEALVAQRLGGVDVLMNNAGIGKKTNALGDFDAWTDVLGVNLWGVIHGTQVFVPGMIARGKPGWVINTGSKQGITTPPGNPAYNVSKAGVKAFTEALQHQLRNTPDNELSAHLLIPGFVHTGMTGTADKPAGAWTPDQTIDFLLESLAAGDFYILCPDNEVTRALDEKRVAWAAGDLIENRPPLSRWHPDYGDAFAAFLKEGC